ncbi:MAG: hypothetical protein JXR37_11820 [Kiritimatiellae bacterium]|nr:hypothetical protein [Kiritimatiellia bacterium]
MKWFPRAIWKYAVLLITLFAIAAVAAHTIISYIDTEIVPNTTYGQTIKSMSWAILALTVGFMFLSGALGLWMIRSIAVAETHRRVGRLVDAMDYLTDGLIVVDAKGRITGCSPSARVLAPREMAQGLRLRDVFPPITAEDLARLLQTSGPFEIEKDVVYPAGLRTMRFRSEPSEGIRLVLLSDITENRRLETREQQMANLRVIGRIARGVAHDFNNILCSILGHADILRRIFPQTDEAGKSLDDIMHSAQKGTDLAKHLLELSRSGQPGVPTEDLARHVHKACELLRLAISDKWRFDVSAEGEFPPVALSPSQVEQSVLNIGLSSADSLALPGELRVTVNRPGHDHLTNVESTFAALIIISAHPSAGAAAPPPPRADDFQPATEDGGVIQSIVRSMLDQVGGRLDVMMLPDGYPILRLCLPYASPAAAERAAAALRREVEAQVGQWTVLLARQGDSGEAVEARLLELGARVERLDNTEATLARIQDQQPPDAMIMEKALLGAEADGLLRAIAKLCPEAGIVVISVEPDNEPEIPTIRFESENADVTVLISALHSAWSAAREARAQAREPHKAPH